MKNRIIIIFLALIPVFTFPQTKPLPTGGGITIGSPTNPINPSTGTGNPKPIGGGTLPTTGGNSSDELTFLSGDGTFEGWFMKVFAKIDFKIWKNADNLKLIGQAIGALGAIIYLSFLGFQMQEGARPWEVTPMLRPIMVALILANWTNFCKLIQYPFEQIANPGTALFKNIQDEAESRRVLRYEKQKQLLDAVIKAKAYDMAKEAELNTTGEKKWTDYLPDLGISDAADKLFSPLFEWRLRFGYKIQQIIANLIDTICLIILRVATYFVFIIQKIWGYILITLGPIAIGMSLIPGFENSLNSWIAKFININLYSFIAYQIINIGQLMIMGAYEMEIERMSEIVNSDGVPTSLTQITLFVTQSGFITTTMFTAVAYLVTAVAILMTPSIADSIVSAGGAGIMSKGKRGTSNVLKGAKTAGVRGVAGAKAGIQAVRNMASRTSR